jgi:hypothetical protein
LSALPPPGRTARYERRLVALFAGVLADINPALTRGGRLLTPVTMSLFGMVNWHYLWFRPRGPISRSEYADLVTRMIADGIVTGRRCSRAPARVSGRHRLSVGWSGEATRSEVGRDWQVSTKPASISHGSSEKLRVISTLPSTSFARHVQHIPPLHE